VNGAKVGVFEETDQIGLRCFLEGKDSWGLESQIILEFRGNFSNESLEWKFSNEEFSALLESSDFSESDCAWSESVGFLDSASGSSGLLCLFVCDVLPGGFASGVLPCGLLGSCHFYIVWFYLELLPLINLVWIYYLLTSISQLPLASYKLLTLSNY
jgi:hypothetical protein